MQKSALFRLWKRWLTKIGDLVVGVEDLAPVRPEPTPGCAEVHSLVCHAHLKLYLFAVKSLLRYERAVRVVVHDDGSLTEDDLALLARHVEGVTVIRREEADRRVAERLRDYPHCRRYRDSFVNAKQIFDYALLSGSRRLIGLDSDVLFLKPPRQVVEWLRGGEEILFGYETQPWGSDQIEKRIGRDIAFVPHVNIGFLCYFGDVLDLDVVEECLSRCESFDWWTGQMLFPILLARSRYEARPLDPRAYTCEKHDDPDAVFKHYCVSGGLRREYIMDMRRLVSHMRHAGENPTAQA
jgi:hypothetical protein